MTKIFKLPAATCGFGLPAFFWNLELLWSLDVGAWTFGRPQVQVHQPSTVLRPTWSKLVQASPGFLEKIMAARSESVAPPLRPQAARYIKTDIALRCLYLFQNGCDAAQPYRGDGGQGTDTPYLTS